MQRNLLLLVTLALLSFLSCAPRGGSGKVMLTYTRWGDPAETESTRELIAQFEKENPGIEVRVDVVGWGQYWQKMRTATVTNTAQDVWLMSSSYIEEYAGAGHVLDLMPFIQADPSFHEDDYFPYAFDSFTYTGAGNDMRPARFGTPGTRLFAFTRDYNCSMLFYNRDHFDALGMAYPDASWTWADLVAAAKKLTIDFDGDGVVDQWGFGGLNYLAFAGVNGAVPLDGQLRKSTYCTPLMVQAIGFCQDLMYRYKVHPPPMIRVDETESFITGKVSMTVAGAWNLRSYNRSEYRWDIAPVPVDVKGRVRRGGGGGVAHCIFARSAHPNEAWKLVKFLSSDVGQKALARSGTSIPVLKRAAFSEDFLAGFDQPPRSSYHVIFDNFTDATPVPSGNARGYLEYTRKISSILDYVWRDQRTPEEACRLIDEQTNAILDEQYGRTRP